MALVSFSSKVEMSLPNTPLQSSAKSKRRSKGGNDSPISRKPDGNIIT